MGIDFGIGIDPGNGDYSILTVKHYFHMRLRELREMDRGARIWD